MDLTKRAFKVVRPSSEASMGRSTGPLSPLARLLDEMSPAKSICEQPAFGWVHGLVNVTKVLNLLMSIGVFQIPTSLFDSSTWIYTLHWR